MTELREALSVLAAGWPHKMDHSQIALYAEMLSDVPADELLAAVKRCVVTDEHRPAVARLRRIVVERRDGIPSVAEAAAQAAVLDDWAEQSAVPIGAGKPRQPPATHPLVRATWEAVGTEHGPSFARAYREAVDARVASLVVERLDAPQLEAGPT